LIPNVDATEEVRFAAFDVEARRNLFILAVVASSALKMEAACPLETCHIPEDGILGTVVHVCFGLELRSGWAWPDFVSSVTTQRLLVSSVFIQQHLLDDGSVDTRKKHEIIERDVFCAVRARAV
jgi:hypothetical protein